MIQASEILILTLIHSLWQGGIIFLFARLCHPLTERFIPLIRRNLLLILLILQIIASFLTALQLSGMNAGGFISIYNTDWHRSISPLLTDILLASYLLIAGFKLSRLIYGYYRLPFEVGFEKSKAPVDLRLFTARQSKLWGIKRNVDVFVSSTIRSPLTYGLFKPVIMIPARIITGLSQRQLEAVLLHELAHIKNLDYSVNILLLISESIYFFNPFIGGICSDIRLEQEKECDRMVLDFMHDPVRYAETLLQISHLAQKNHIPAPAFNGSESRLFDRVRFIAELPAKRLSDNRWIIPVLLIPALAVTLFSSFLDFPQSQEVKAIDTNSKIFRQPLAGVPLIAEPVKEKKKITSGKSVKKIPISAKDRKKANIPTMTAQPSAQADMDMNPAPAVEYANIASKTEPLEKKQMILTEEMSGGRIIKMGYTLTRYPDKWEYHLDWMRVEEKEPADSLPTRRDLQPQ